MRGVIFGQEQPELTPLERLFCSVIRQAILDAQRGDKKAGAWLKYICPNWRARVAGQRMVGAYVPADAKKPVVNL